MKKVVIFVFFLFFLFTSCSQASSEYILPYPSFLPGSPFYKLSLIKEMLDKFWYFGNFGQFTYYLKESDKYLVESKTLFEYKQYLLAIDSLKKSDNFFLQTLPNLSRAKDSGEDISEQRKILRGASLKHIEVLEKLNNDVPSIFYWAPEKGKPQVLNIRSQIDNSIEIRKKYL